MRGRLQRRRLQGELRLLAEFSADDRASSLDAGNRTAPWGSGEGPGQYLINSTSNENGDLSIRRRLGRL